MKKYNLDIAAPTDGRYESLCSDINKIFSEHNLIKTVSKLKLNGLYFYLTMEGLNLYQNSRLIKQKYLERFI